MERYYYADRLIARHAAAAQRLHFSEAHGNWQCLDLAARLASGVRVTDFNSVLEFAGATTACYVQHLQLYLGALWRFLTSHPQVYLRSSRDSIVCFIFCCSVSDIIR